MKLIFLDVNGVIDSFNHSREMGLLRKSPYGIEHYFDWNCLHNLYKIVEATDAYIVISSEWKSSKKLMKRLLSVLSFYGLDERVIGRTPRIVVKNNGWSKVDRGKEILSFLDKHPCEDYVVLDDIPWDLDPLADRLVLTNPTYGLTEEDANKAINILNEKEKTLHM